MRKAVLWSYVALMILIAVPVHAQGRTAAAVVQSFVDAGFPITEVVAYDEETDVNHILGRPGQYVEKVSFRDARARFPQDELSVDRGGTVERFATRAAYDNRLQLLERLADTALFGSYLYPNPAELLIMRVTFDLTPSAAADYERAFLGG